MDTCVELRRRQTLVALIGIKVVVVGEIGVVVVGVTIWALWTGRGEKVCLVESQRGDGRHVHLRRRESGPSAVWATASVAEAKNRGQSCLGGNTGLLIDGPLSNCELFDKLDN